VRLSSSALEPGPRLIEKPDIAAQHELSVVNPDFHRMELTVVGIYDGALVVISGRTKVSQDHQPQDGCAFVGARAGDAGFWFALLVVRLRQGHDLAKQFAALFSPYRVCNPPSVTVVCTSRSITAPANKRSLSTRYSGVMLIL
jgi:hypothetical protein